METFGRKLRQAVASQGLRLDQLVKSTGLPIEHIQALAGDDFDALPEDATVEKGLRHFARLVDVDPDQVIEDFRQERQRWLESQPPPVEATPPPPRPGRRPGLATPALAIVAIAAVAFFIWFRSSATGSGRPPTVVGEMKSTSETEVPRVDPPVPVDQDPPIERRMDTSDLSIPRYGVGRDIVDHELVGEAEHFSEGERVWFWTRVEGGTAGMSIDHVWIHEGVEALRVPLNLGGARWRTQSYKHMAPGSSGRWSIEARDETGSILARREFVCSSRP